MSTPVTALPAIAMRIVRVICELAAMVANVAGDDMAADDRALAGRGAAGVGEEPREAGQLGVGPIE